MTPLEQLFRHEIEFHRRLRESSQPEASGPTHTSFALQHGYDGLLRALGEVGRHDVEVVRERLTLSGELRDVLAARDSVKQLLGLSVLDM